MSILPIIKYGDSVLRTEAAPVEDFDQDLETLARDMVETLRFAGGIGLAANQVSVVSRLIIVDPSAQERPADLQILVNPVILSVEGKHVAEEGCLSIPDFTAEVSRPWQIVYRAKDLKGNTLEESAEGLKARIICHEVDHLNGVLFIDLISSLKRDLIRRKIRRRIKAGTW